jgi:hypothetical protein
MRSLVRALALLSLLLAPAAAQELTDDVCREVAAGFARELGEARAAGGLAGDASIAIAAPASGSLEHTLRAALTSSQPPFVVRGAGESGPVDLLVTTALLPGGSGSHRTLDLVVELVDVVSWTTVARARWSAMSVPQGGDEEEALPLVGPFDLRAAADELARKVSERAAKGWPEGWPPRPVVSVVRALRRGAELVDPALAELALRDALWRAGGLTLTASGAATDQVLAELDRSKKTPAPAARQGLVSTSVEVEAGEGESTRVTITILLIDTEKKRPIVATRAAFSR